MNSSKLLIAGCLLAFLLTSGTTPLDNNSSQLKGSWTLIKYKYGTETDLSDVPKIITYVKNITDTHFSWASYGEDGNIIAAGGGTYTVNGQIYTENIEYFHPLGSNLPGSSVDWDYTISGNDWTISGHVRNVQINPGSGKFESIDSVRLEEVWRKL